MVFRTKIHSGGREKSARKGEQYRGEEDTGEWEEPWLKGRDLGDEEGRRGA